MAVFFHWDMAEHKKSFVLYADMIHQFDHLDDVEAGKLIKIIFQYVNDMNPIVTDKLLKIAFEPIKRQLKRDLSEWEITKGERSKSGILGNLKRWHIDIYDKIISKEITLERGIEIANSRKQSHSDNSESLPSQTVANVAVTVNDTVNGNVTDTVTYFILSEKIINDITPIDYCLKNFKPIIDAHLMNFGGGRVSPDQFKDNFSKYYPAGTSFKDDKHIQNAIRSSIKELAKPKSKEVNKNPSLNEF